MVGVDAVLEEETADLEELDSVESLVIQTLVDQFVEVMVAVLLELG